MKVRFGVLVSSGMAFPRREDLAKFKTLIDVIDGAGVEMIGTYDTSFIGAFLTQHEHRYDVKRH